MGYARKDVPFLPNRRGVLHFDEKLKNSDLHQTYIN